MRELFLVEKDDHRLRITSAVALLAAAVFLLIFVGCAPAKQAAVDKSKPWAAVSFTIDKTTKYAPSFAIWVQDTAGGEAAILYATGKAAKNSWSGAASRPGALPVWSAARKIAAQADTVTTATPSDAAAITVQIPEKFKGRQLVFFIEANASYDYNDYYREDLKAGDEGYSDVNGQPSVVWQASADTAAHPSGTLGAQIAGHGDVLGANGDIDADMGHVTTAAALLSSVKIEYDMAGK